jgi:putative transposase
LDETSPQTTSNTQPLWSLRKPVIFKNTSVLKANTFGFYALNGTSVVDHMEHSKKEDVCAFLDSIRKANPEGRIVLVLDNFRSHWANATREHALSLNIELVFLPPYSPDLNPIEFIWKSIKKVISKTFVENREHLRQLIGEAFRTLSKSLSFAKAWIEKFLEEPIRSQLLGA